MCIMRRVIGIGETVLDIIFKNDKPVDAIPGGSTFNALISLGRTLPKQVPVLMVTEIGDDHIGEMIVSFMEGNGVSSEAVSRSVGHQSHISTAFLDSNNDAHYEFFKDHASAGLSADKIEGITFTNDDIVLFGSFFAVNPVIRSSTAMLLKRAREAGAILYYDINFRKSHLKDLPLIADNIVENCALADFVRGSSDDFSILYGTSDGRRIYDEHIAPFCRNFILTRGAEPTEVYQNDLCWSFPVPQVETVSTIGAGDNFNAGFIYSLIIRNYYRDAILQHSDWKGIITVASKFSSAVCMSIYNYVDSDFDFSR